MKVRVVNALTLGGVEMEIGTTVELDADVVRALRGAVEVVGEAVPAPVDLADDAPVPVPVWTSVQ